MNINKLLLESRLGLLLHREIRLLLFCESCTAWGIHLIVIISSGIVSCCKDLLHSHRIKLIRSYMLLHRTPRIHITNTKVVLPELVLVASVLWLSILLRSVEWILIFRVVAKV